MAGIATHDIQLLGQWHSDAHKCHIKVHPNASTRYCTVCAAKRTARQLARGWKTPPPPRRERKAPRAEATAAEGEGESGEAEVEAREEGGSA